jgi:hypothetical protein
MQLLLWGFPAGFDDPIDFPDFSVIVGVVVPLAPALELNLISVEF